MTAAEAVARTDRLKPNRFTDADKVGWLSRLDGLLYKAVVLTHIQRTETADPTPYDAGDAEDTELLVPDPWAADIYHYWLSAQIDKENGEIERFNQNITMFNSVCEMYTDWYHRTHAPAPETVRWNY